MDFIVRRMDLKRSYGGGSVIIWVGIIDQTISGSFKVEEEVKLNSANYCDFMDKTLFAWYKSLTCNFKEKCVLIHDISPAYESKLILEFIEHKRFTEEKIMEWPPSSPVQNLIQNLWSIVKMKLNVSGNSEKQTNGKQFFLFSFFYFYFILFFYFFIFSQSLFSRRLTKIKTRTIEK